MCLSVWLILRKRRVRMITFIVEKRHFHKSLSLTGGAEIVIFCLLKTKSILLNIFDASNSQKISST